jgi:cytoskeleton protein RodZ
MGDLGRYLHDLRERKGISLEEVSRVTRIGKSHLAALEAEEFAELPAPVFVKGFLRSYCEALHERPDQALAFYEAVPTAVPASRLVPARRPPPRSSRRTPLVAALLLLIVLAGGLAALQLATRRGAGPATPTGRSGSVVNSAPPSPSAPVGAAVQGRADATGPAASSPAPEARTAAAPAPAGVPAPGQRLVARAIEPTWLRVQMDGGEAVQELLPAGATREWTAERRFVLTIGNAGGIELTLNGRPVPSLGARGAVIRDLVLPREEAAKPAS